MKRWIMGTLTGGLVLLPCKALAQTEALPARHAMLGGERLFAYWVLALCSVLFVALVCVWSVRLKRASDDSRRAAQAKAPKP